MPCSPHPLSPGAPGCWCDANCFCYLCQEPTVLWHSTDRTESLSYFCVCLRKKKCDLPYACKKTPHLSFLLPLVLAFPVAASVSVWCTDPSLWGFGRRKSFFCLKKSVATDNEKNQEPFVLNSFSWRINKVSMDEYNSRKEIESKTKV